MGHTLPIFSLLSTHARQRNCGETVLLHDHVGLTSRHRIRGQAVGLMLTDERLLQPRQADRKDRKDRKNNIVHLAILMRHFLHYCASMCQCTLLIEGVYVNGTPKSLRNPVSEVE